MKVAAPKFESTTIPISDVKFSKVFIKGLNTRLSEEAFKIRSTEADDVHGGVAAQFIAALGQISGLSRCDEHVERLAANLFQPPSK